MLRNRIAATLLLAQASMAWCASAPGLEYRSVWQCDAPKFHWYCEEDAEPPEEQKPPAKTKTKEEQAMEELLALRKSLEDKKALAIMHPTPEHIADYVKAQEAMMDRASVFSDLWRRLVWQNPELNYELKRPVNNAGIVTYNDNRRDSEKNTMEAISKEWGIFFFFRSDCPYCHRMAGTLKYLSDQYGVTVFPISTDGRGIPLYPNPHADNGIVAALDVKQVPMIVLANIKDRRLIPLGSGVIASQEIIERIYVLTQSAPGTLY